MKRTLLSILILFPFLASAQSITPAWVDAIGGAAGDEVIQSTVVDASGNVYIGGSFEGTVNFNPNGTAFNLTSAGLYDAFFAKYTSAGVLVWANKLGSTGGDEIYAVQVDAAGSVYVAGYFTGTVDFDPSASVGNLTSGGLVDIFYGKYSSAGALTWANGHGSTDNDAAIAIKVDLSGNVYVTGYFFGTVDFDPNNVTVNSKTAVGGTDIFLMKLTSAGALGWIDTFGSTAGDVGYSVDIDASNVYISGYYSGTTDFDPGTANSATGNLGGSDAFFGKYTIASGALVWWATVRSTGNDEATSIVVSGTNFYLGGIFSDGASFFSNSGNLAKTSNGLTDIFIAKYDGTTALPDLTWINSIGTTTDERLNLLALDASGNVYCTGNFQGTVDFDADTGTANLISAGSQDIFIASYDASIGSYRFANAIGGTLDDDGTTVAVDATNNVYLGGYFQNTASFDFTSSVQNKTSQGFWDGYIGKYAFSTLSAEPTAQPTNLVVVGLNSTDFTYDITPAANVTGGYLHIYKVGSAPTSLPVDGVEYFQGDVLTDGSIVKYSDNVAAGNFYGSLTAGTTYYVKIFAYNGSGASTNYRTTSPLSATITTTGGGSTPSISSFTPTSGPVGTSITITGTNFSTTPVNNIVKFNGATAVVTASTATAITTSVPTSATTGKITVEVAGQIATSVTDFIVPTGWTTMASMLTPRWGSGIGNVGDIAYVAGGYIPTNHLTAVEAYTVSTNSWVAKTSRPSVQTSPAYGVINSILYTAGGTNTSVEISDLWSYNASNDTWTSKTSMPAVRQAACGGVINGQFYVVGGRVGSVSQSSMIVYDPNVNTWSAKTAMPTARYAAAAGVINGLLYVAGGMSAESSTVFSTLEAYDPVANTWSTKASMPTARYGAAYEVLNGMLFVIGGGNSASTVVSTVEAYNPTSNTWSTIPSLTFARAYAAAIVSNGAIFVTGGHNNANTAVSAVEQYGVSTATPTISSFNPTSALPGATVTITGTNFSTTAALNIVKFNGTTAIVTASTATSITTTVPSGATTGTISVTVGSLTGTSSGSFTVTTAATPTVTNFNPTSGAVGTSVTITGTNFSATPANNTVKFNGTTASVTASTATTITTSVPSGATTGTITVTVGSQTATSSASFTVSTVTLATEPTNQPTALTFSSITSTSYAFAYTAAAAGTTTPDGYLGIRKTGSAPTGAPVDGVTYAYPDVIGDGTVNFVGTGTSWTQSGASPSTSYYYAIYSYKGSGTSINYKQVSPLTGSVTTLSGTDTSEPFVANNTTPTSVAKGSPITVTVQLTDPESGIASSIIYYSPLEDAKSDFSNFISGTMTKTTGDTYTFQIPGTAVKEMGVEYYFYTTNGVGLDNYSSDYTVSVQLTADGLTIPFTGFGSDQTKYRIVSIPIQPTTSTAEAVFGDDLGAYDKKSWRLFRYQGTTTELNGKSTLAVGNGYWLIASKNTKLDTGPGTTPTAAIWDPFKLTFTPGWNQIGNPYPYDIKWQAILDWNGNPSGITKLRTYNGNWVDGAELEKFSGGFVMNAGSSSITLEIPTIKDPSINGRSGKSADTEVKNPIDNQDWSITLSLEQGGLTNELGGFGMNHSAAEGYDAFDDFNLPRFMNYIELNHVNKELHHFSYSKDVVPYDENHTWEFSIESNGNEPVTMRWDNSYFGDNTKHLVLWDVTLQRGFDMRTLNLYEFNRFRSGQFKVFFGDEKYIKEKTAVNEVVFHDVFPNPARNLVKVSFSVPTEDRLTIEVIDLLGRKIATIADENFKPGYHEVMWNTQDSFGSEVTNGVYITQIKSLNKDQQKRLIINK